MDDLAPMSKVQGEDTSAYMYMYLFIYTSYLCIIIIRNTIKSITFNQISKQKRLIDIKLDSSITNSEHNVILYVNDKSYYQEKKDGEYLTLDLSLFSMNNLFEIYFMQKGGNQSFETVIKRVYVVLEKLPTKNEISLILVDNQLIVK